MPKYLFLAVSLLVSTTTLAQTTPSPVPASYSFKAASDYDRYVPQVLATIDWLETSPLPNDSEERRAANTFLVQWISGSPTVSVAIEEYVSDLSYNDGALLIAFMGGWTRHALQNPGTKDKLALATAGIQNMLATHKAQSGTGNKKLEEVGALAVKGKLPEWVKKHVKA
ncbi:MAG TPA: hypothetical protein VFO93_20580 [Hymenobacter sp.]|uniref:hypothetical protein n=1 Tax=Hymenobacter sp. TaxID=1898978 RepID=UPI002D807B45|nr:hypothetical protein [Hymenobacter sp.]HET9505955.1 hypothetical protein [Hymenobacter sp.]